MESVDKGVAEMRTYTYVYDNEDIVIEYTASAFSEETARFVHGPGIDEPLAMEKGGQAYYYHADGLGSIVKMTDGTGKAAQAYEYDSFGKLHDKMNAIKQPYAFTGREFDKDTGLYYYRARYYDAEAGRFTTKDPVRGSIERPQTLNPYAYAWNNPVNWIDPWGLQAQCNQNQCTQSWAQCYTNCINTLAPGFTQFFLGSQIAGNLPYNVIVRSGPQGNLIVREVPHAISLLYPRAWRAAATVSRVVRPVQAVVFSYVAGASYGCMISCGINSCNY